MGTYVESYGTRCQSQDEKENVKPPSEVQPAELHEQGSKDEAESAPVVSTPEASSNPTQTAEETENERKWKEAMAFLDEKRRAAEAAAAKAALQEKIEEAKRLEVSGVSTTAAEQAQYEKVKICRGSTCKPGCNWCCGVMWCAA